MTARYVSFEEKNLLASWCSRGSGLTMLDVALPASPDALRQGPRPLPGPQGLPLGCAGGHGGREDGEARCQPGAAVHRGGLGPQPGKWPEKLQACGDAALPPAESPDVRQAQVGW